MAALAGQSTSGHLMPTPGQRIPLFPQGRPPQALESVGAMTFDSGLVQMRFQTKPQP